MARGSRIVAIAVLGSLLFAACSSKSSSSTDTGTPAVTASASAATGSGSGAVVDVTSCQAVGAAVAAATGGLATAMGGDTSQLQQALGQLQGYVDQAPDEIKGDLNTLATGYQQFMQAIADSGYDPNSGQAPTAAQLAAITAAGSIFNDADFKTASGNVSAWVKANCG